MPNSAAYSPSAIIPADISLKDNGTPVSAAFDDVYFSADDGFAESRYVFIAHNKLWQRWQAFAEQPNSTSPFFVIAETGFGTGLNFLLTCLLFQQFKTEYPDSRLQLHYISFEKHPIPLEHLSTILAGFVAREPELARFTTQLCQHYPSFIPGCHRLTIDTIQLDLHFGDIIDCIEVIPSSSKGLVDAWYLDGFAPSKNAAMWSESVLLKMGALAKQHATFSTFTAAGFVKRALQAAGFTINKVKGFGRKRDMLTGVWTGDPPEETKAYTQPSQGNARHKDITVIGGGLASAALLYELAKTPALVGNVTLLCSDEGLAEAASGNRQGGFYPLLHADYDPLTEFYSIAFDYAYREYQALRSHVSFTADFCGVLALAHNDDYANRYQKVRNSARWPEHYAQWLTAEQTTNAANLSLPYAGFHYPNGGWISPPSLTNALIQFAQSRLNVTLRFNTEVKAIHAQHNGWSLTVNNQDQADTPRVDQQLSAEIVVLCAGATTQLLTNTTDEKTLPITPVRGQVSYPTATPSTQPLRKVLCFSGYMTPTMQGQHCIGSTFKKRDMHTEVRPEEHEEIKQLFTHDFAATPWAKELCQQSGNVAGNAAIRATLPDHLPLVGSVPHVAEYHKTYAELWKHFPNSTDFPPDHNNLYVLSGLGARGLCSAPLAASILASQLLGKPYPVSERILQALTPNRFLIRQLRKPPK